MASKFKTQTVQRLATTISAALAVAAISLAPWSAHATDGAQSGASQGTHQSPNATCPSGGQCFSDVPESNPFAPFVNTIYQEDIVGGYACGGPGEPCDAQSRPYYRPNADVTRAQMAKFVDNARNMPGISIDTDTYNIPLFVRTDAAGASGISIKAETLNGTALHGSSVYNTGVYGSSTTPGSKGVHGVSFDGTGVYGESGNSHGVQGHANGNSRSGVLGVNSLGFGAKGESQAGIGVHGSSTSGAGVWGTSNSDDGVHGVSSSSNGVFGASSSGYGVYAYSGNSRGLYVENGDVQGIPVATFNGDVEVTGACCLASANITRIDHPLDPANKYLQHAAVESPDMKTVYDGVATTDANGDAIVTLPDYFEALNGDYRYQLTPIGQFAQAIISKKIEKNTFAIKTDKPNVEVSWQVTGIRKDAFAKQNPIESITEKSEKERGLYKNPDAFGQPESKGILYEQSQKGQAAKP